MPKVHVISIDEKTGIQALYRTSGRAPVSKKYISRTDPEYIRNGTTTLIAGIDTKEGKIVHYRLHSTRTEEDFAIFICELTQMLPKDDIVIFIVDQLNIHLSESLVRFVEKEAGSNEDLGEKRKKGVLFDKKSRKAYLQDDTHRIRIVFTPKHCSWLNPIENWFAKLQRQIITRGNFCSVDDLERKIIQYIEYYNLVKSKPLKWKFKGFWKIDVLHNSRSA